jgi:hypothetical protein
LLLRNYNNGYVIKSKKEFLATLKQKEKIKNQNKIQKNRKEEESIYIPLELTHNQHNFHYKSLAGTC